MSVSPGLPQGLNVTTHEKAPQSLLPCHLSHQCVRLRGVYRYLRHLPLTHRRPQAPHEREAVSLRLLLRQILGISGSQDTP